jgi:hypothetical protein
MKTLLAGIAAGLIIVGIPLAINGTPIAEDTDTAITEDSPGGSAVATEDSPGWDCRTDGNRMCGLGNDQHAPAGCYGTNGRLVVVWPCEVKET